MNVATEKARKAVSVPHVPRRKPAPPEEVQARLACAAYFGCGCGGRIFDELDPMELANMLTPEERDAQEAGLYCEAYQDPFEILIAHGY